jgi:uncharacterized SAM-binding protein YcdF (DUF218 family)
MQQPGEKKCSFLKKRTKKLLWVWGRGLPASFGIGQSTRMSLADLPTVVIVPPLNCLVAACVGAVWHRRRAGRVLLAAGLAGLVLLSLPVVSGTLLSRLEQGLPEVPPADDPPQAIVILSADETETLVDDRIGFIVGHLTLEREQAGVRLARRTGLPILVSGGQVRPGSPSLAELMASSMREDFDIDPAWLEERSQDTWQNAADSAVILRNAGITSVYVVTSVWHMRRALMAFHATGLTVTAAPTLPERPPPLTLRNLLPHVSSWQMSYYALHEWIGCAWYALRG